MTSWVVVDSGLYLAIGLHEPFAANAQALLDSLIAAKYQMAAPYLFRYELALVTRKYVARGRITLDDAQEMLRGLLREPVEPFADEQLLRRAYELATEYNRPTAYDSLYLALAEQLDCEFWTADLKLFNAVSTKLTWVKWIGNFELPQPSAQS
jgi:predicted nucleic acid-binding protein